MSIPRFGAPPRGARRHRLRAGAYAVIRARGGVLLTVQHAADGPPETQLPGGGLDPGEQPLRALHREVMEETGWTLAAPRRLGAYRVFVPMAAGAFARVAAGPEPVRAEKLCTVYAARAGRRLGPPGEAGHAAVVLAPAAARRALGCEGQRALLDRAVALGLL